jgi:hypothetical protein
MPVVDIIGVQVDRWPHVAAELRLPPDQVEFHFDSDEGDGKLQVYYIDSTLPNMLTFIRGQQALDKDDGIRRILIIDLENVESEDDVDRQILLHIDGAFEELERLYPGLVFDSPTAARETIKQLLH